MTNTSLSSRRGSEGEAELDAGYGIGEFGNWVQAEVD